MPDSITDLLSAGPDTETRNTISMIHLVATQESHRHRNLTV